MVNGQLSAAGARRVVAGRGEYYGGYDGTRMYTLS